MGAVKVSCQVEGAANTRHRLWAASLGGCWHADKQTPADCHVVRSWADGRQRVICLFFMTARKGLRRIGGLWGVGMGEGTGGVSPSMLMSRLEDDRDEEWGF